MAKEYIDREALEKFIYGGINNPDKNNAFGHDAVEILAEIYIMSSADVAEVRHGEWKIGTVHPHNHEIASFVCTACRGLNRKDSNYCPNCGADMRGSKNE